MKEIQSEDQFEQEIQNRVIVDFYAPWCGPCRQVTPMVEDSNARTVKVNVDELPSVAQEYNVMSVPTLKLFEDGKELDSIIGTTTKNRIEEMYQQ